MSAEEIDRALSTLRSTQGAFAAFDDGTVVLSDSFALVTRALDLLDQVERVTVPTWCIQFHVISLSESARREFGIDVQPSVDLSANLAAAAVGSPTGAASGRVALHALLKASRDRDYVTVQGSPLLVLVDGEQGRFRRGSKIPIAKKVVSPQGTTTTTGFQLVEVGFEITASVRESSATTGRLAVSLENSEQTGEIEGSPITSGLEWSGAVLVESGGVYLVAEFERQFRRESVLGPFQLRKEYASENGVVQVWATVARVGGPISRVLEASSVDEQGAPD